MIIINGNLYPISIKKITSITILSIANILAIVLVINVYCFVSGFIAGCIAALNPRNPDKQIISVWFDNII